ncbi:MAG: DUF1294 domain-containing protein [Firmicutes bacterium]|nr:DUF1294 domain-containing protein [Bacillota bacterium]
MKPLLWIAALWLIWNLFTFLQMGMDKRKAVKEKQRISEKTLLLSAFCMGAVGSGAGMLVFHHKTKKWKFRILVPLALAVNLAVICIGIYLIQN